MEADELAMDLPFDDHLVVVDVRKEPEFGEGHVKDAVNLPQIAFRLPGVRRADWHKEGIAGLETLSFPFVVVEGDGTLEQMSSTRGGENR